MALCLTGVGTKVHAVDTDLRHVIEAKVKGVVLSSELGDRPISLTWRETASRDSVGKVNDRHPLGGHVGGTS